MKKIYPLIVFFTITVAVKAQQQIPTDQPYDKIDTSDLEIKKCDFEKDANAEVLIDKANLYYDPKLRINIDYHIRIKIFNDDGKNAANVRIPFISYDEIEGVDDIAAETINLINGNISRTKIDKKQIFTQVIDKYRREIVFTFPDVKAGSVLDYKYTWSTLEFYNIPTWYFQNHFFPVRYSEITTRIPQFLYFGVKTNNLVPFAINNTTQKYESFNEDVQKIAMVNLPSLANEPLMASIYDNLQNIRYQLITIRPVNGVSRDFLNTWLKVGRFLNGYYDFGVQQKRNLKDEDVIIAAVKALKTNDEKIAYIFDAVKTAMRWNEYDDWHTDDGTVEAWNKKSGNSAEINLILYHLLKKAGINALPMLVSTREHGRVNPAYTNLVQFNRTIVYIPVDSTKRYILDATGKYNIYNEIPYDLLNSWGLYVDYDSDQYDLIFLTRAAPVRQSVFIQADFQPGNKLTGTVRISSRAYNRINNVTKYKTDGEQKYIDYLTDGDNTIKITSLKMENMDVDTLPLIQNFNFETDLSGSDGNYIYFNPNQFSGMHKNPFLGEVRNTDIDFGFLNDLTVNGIYKIPAGYKSNVLPKSIQMAMPDNSIIFKRFVGEQDGSIVVRYTINFNKTIFFKEDYKDIYAFYKKMYELMNEQIMLKKS